MSAGSDGLVALGGVLHAATEAYRSNEEQRTVEVKRLRSELYEAKQRAEELQAKIDAAQARTEAVQSEANDAIAKVLERPLLKFDLLDVAGAWFSQDQKARVVVTEGGACDYDNGMKQQIAPASGTLVLAGTHTLSLFKSSRKRLIWEGATVLTWTQENVGGSRQVTITLDVTKVLKGEQIKGHHADQQTPERKRTFRFPFSLIGCDVNLLLCRNKKGADGKMIEGEQFFGAHFGLQQTQTKRGSPEPPNNITAITCTSRVEIRDVNTKKWVHLSRTIARRFEAGGNSFGNPEALTFDRFKQIVGATTRQQECGKEHFKAEFRVTITDIGLLELCQRSEQALQPE